MDTSKSKIHISKNFPKTKLGSSTSSNTQNSSTKKDYSKNKKPEDIGFPSFGQTGMTGES